MSKDPPPLLPTPATQSAVPGAPPGDEDRLLGMLVHLLAILSGFVGPLVLWLVKKDESSFLNHHGRETLNFQFTLLLIAVALVPIGGALFFFTMGLGTLLLFPLLIGVSIFALVVEILCCVRAWEGQSCRYPFSIRFLS